VSVESAESVDAEQGSRDRGIKMSIAIEN